jgi:hypothetical protein
MNETAILFSVRPTGGARPHHERRSTVKLNKTIFTILSIILAFTIMAASTGAAKAYRIKRGETTGFANGRSGVSFTNSQYAGTVYLNRITEERKLPDNHPEFLTKPLDVRLADLKGNRVTHIVGSVYVYFKVRRADVRAWEEGRLAVYFYDTWTKEWEDCGTFEVRDGTTSALGCRMRVFGLYGIGEK